jgi:hypothetical protein
MTEFWVSSGHHLTRRDGAGELVVTDELLMAWLARPELMPPDDACDAERALHADLLTRPRREVGPEEIAALADADARENWTQMLSFRDRLLAAGTIESGYRALVREGMAGVPPLFLDQLACLIMRNALDGCADPWTLRAAELFFVRQRAAFHDGALLLASAERIEEAERARHAAPLAAMFADRPPQAELDVLAEETEASYWSRSDAFAMAFNLTRARSRAALANAIAAWVAHMGGRAVAVEPLAAIEDEDWRWFVGLDAEGTRIGNAMWRGEALDAAAIARVLALFRLSYERDPPAALDGRPVYLILAMTAERAVRLKPQNLVAGLPDAAPGGGRGNGAP